MSERSNALQALLQWGAKARSRYGFAYLDANGTPLPSQGIQLWITCRMTHCFALAAKRHGANASEYRELATHGIACLNGVFHDERFGGYYSALDFHTGQPLGEGQKEGYAHAFVLLAAASAVGANIAGGEQLLHAASADFHAHWFDGTWVHERYTRTWDHSEPYRGVNCAMHSVEAALAVGAITGDEVWLEIAEQLTTAVVGELAPTYCWRIPEHLDTTGEVQLDFNRENPADPFRPYGATPGHWWEWARLTWHLLAQADDRIDASKRWRLATNARELCVAAWREAWEVDGAPGPIYTVDFAGTPIVRARMHWVVCEAYAAVHAGMQFADELAPRLTAGVTFGERGTWEQWARTIAAYAHRYLIVRPGVWHHELDHHNQPASTCWVGRPDIYHAFQALILPTTALATPLAVAT
ncbi:MAG: AGE family epimerase/isomerase [Bowdeniella nasicola]|nr:AGE family epimerase/isomerase [Bowdeniella nasicola]